MTDAELVIIGKLVDLCRAKGVRVLKNDGFEIQLGEPVEKMPAGPVKAAVDPDLCRCGHAEHLHTAGACLNGCDPDKCLPPEARPT